MTSIVIDELIGEPHLDGALAGGASLDVRSFGEIISRSRSLRYSSHVSLGSERRQTSTGAM